MSIRDSFAPDVGGLGKKVERPKETPLDREIKPGIVQGQDGKLRTSLPLPPLYPGQPSPPVWPFRVDGRDLPDSAGGDAC